MFKFINAKTLGSGATTIRTTYWNSFLSRLKYFTTNEFPKLHIIREKDFTFNELPIDEMINNNIETTSKKLLSLLFNIFIFK